VLDNLLLLKKDMSSLAEYSAEGNLQRRLEIKNYVGDWQSIVFGVNAILDEALTPVNSQVFVLQNMLDGLLTSRFNDDFKGDHNRIKVVVNKISAVAEKALKDLEIMVTASREGDLKRRIPVDDYVGDWKSIMLGVNAILDEALTPVNSQAIVLQNMADGLLTSRITDDFKGDHNRIKDAVNKIAVVAEKALKDLELMDVAARENDLNRRIYEDDYVGDWKTIMMSVNSVAETIQVKTESLQLQNWLKTGSKN
jgi:methyl-accepting chemotaxis protein